MRCMANYEKCRYAINIHGIVQGVGFRPFLYRLATSHNLLGFCRNTPGGVYCEVEGRREDCKNFIKNIRENAPPLSSVKGIDVREIDVACDENTADEKTFKIIESEHGGHETLISPDIAICPACRHDIFDKNNRRYLYPFTNCTDCGPRFTIIKDVPYDRENTTMASFTMCQKCAGEYTDPASRRFHAQPNACPVCGPSLSFLTPDGSIHDSADAIKLFDEYIKNGKIVAVKGLGGYNLACDAENEAATARLRELKHRYGKPFAVMVRDVECARSICYVSPDEEALLSSPRAPIVLLRAIEGARIAPSVAPGLRRLGIMLAYTPLHAILFKDRDTPLVMTSANVSERPMIYKDTDTEINELFTISDAVLTHNRPIYRRLDDSVTFVAAGAQRLVRRARGYVPEPISILRGDDGKSGDIIAFGAQMKNTFCLLRDNEAFVSGHNGDLDEPESEKSYLCDIDDFVSMFNACPTALACDLHPGYVSTRVAEKKAAEFRLPLYKIQHHRAHFASVLAEHNISGGAVGFIFDGTGYGDDGTVWGGEAFVGGLSESKRAGHLLPFPLLGGEAAVREPWRCAVSLADGAMCRKAIENLFPDREHDVEILLSIAKAGINSPLTSSMGRLFDAVAAIAGVRGGAVDYEGQAAAELESVIDESADGAYSFEIYKNENNVLIFDWRRLIRDAIDDALRGVGAPVISARFHRACCNLVADAAEILCQKSGFYNVALSGGCFANVFLLEGCIRELRARGLRVYTNEKVSAGDGGISFGQAAAASEMMKRERQVRSDAITMTISKRRIN